MFKVNGAGIDLYSVDIQRGRDTGINPFYVYVEYCTGKTVRDWADLLSFFEPTAIALFADIHESAFDLDLLTGLLLEKRDSDILYGTIGQCIIGKQYWNLKFGDRHFYSFSSKPLPLTARKYLRLVRLSQI